MMELAVYLVIAVFILSRLYSSLGKVSGSDLFRDFTFDKEGSAEGDSVVEGQSLEITTADAQLISLMDEKLSIKTSQVLESAKLIDKFFSITEFLDGAEKAFEKIIKGFQEGDVKSLSCLVDAELLKKLEEKIKERPFNHEYRSEFVRIARPVITDISIDSSIVNVDVNFYSEQINFVRNTETDKIVSGSVSKIAKINDLWCIRGDLNLSSMRWKLVSTSKDSKDSKTSKSSGASEFSEV